MKKLLVLLCASAIVISACSSSQEPVAPEQSAPVKHKHHKRASGINCDK